MNKNIQNVRGVMDLNLSFSTTTYRKTMPKSIAVVTAKL
jgi:hypothetical protein